MFEQLPYCTICHQLIHSGDPSVMRLGGRAHTRCIDVRYYPQDLPEKIKLKRSKYITVVTSTLLTWTVGTSILLVLECENLKAS